MEFLFLLIALVVAIVALSKAKQAARAVEQLTREIALLRARLDAGQLLATAPYGEDKAVTAAAEMEAKRAEALAEAQAEAEAKAARIDSGAAQRARDFALSAIPRVEDSEKTLRALEDSITSRWMVWLGGAAIALGGVFLVKYAIDRELLGPSNMRTERSGHRTERIALEGPRAAVKHAS